VTVEVEFCQGEAIKLNRDVYSLTIGANLSGNCSPTEYIYCLQLCVFVFIFQISVAYFFSLQFITFSALDLEIMQINHTLVRALSGLLL
jgi:hypothetical protein